MTLKNKIAEARALIDGGKKIYQACNEVGISLNQWNTANKKPFWRDATGPKPSGQVLVVYLEGFFGKLVAKTTIAYYDNPKDYGDENQGKGWTDWLTEKQLLVTHWTPIPPIPAEMENLDLTQDDAKKKIPGIFDTPEIQTGVSFDKPVFTKHRYNLGSINIQELK